jgi:BRCA1-associated protein
MDVSTQRVWDYAGDNFVHRLIQNQSDGKLVELPSASGKGNKASDDDDGVVGLKYVYLMTSQLESQREYYESLCASANEGAADSERRALATERENASLKTELEELRREKDSYVPQLEKELEKLREKYERLDALTHKLQDNYAEEKSMSKRLIAKLELLTEEKKTHEATISDLNEQIRDLMFYLDARNKLSDAGEDVQQGSVVVPVSKGKGRRKR